MSKSAPIQIKVNKPCSEDWNSMTATEQGRHCAHCQKTVIDFTNWTDAMLYEFFTKNKEQKVCGRFQPYQLNRNINIPYQPHSRLYMMFVGLGLTLLLTHIPNQSLHAQAPLTQQQIKCKNSNTSTGVKIQIIDTIKPWMPFSVLIRSNDSVVDFSRNIGNGYYENLQLLPGQYDILIIRTGSEGYRTNVSVQEKEIVTINPVLGPRETYALPNSANLEMITGDVATIETTHSVRKSNKVKSKTRK